jgi:gamma-glutamyl-gamma-aminobutyrate hydrolase PuuD
MDLPPPAPQIVLPANAQMLVAFCVGALLRELSQRLGRIAHRGLLPRIKAAVRISTVAGIKMTTRCRDISEAQVNSMNLSI